MAIQEKLADVGVESLKAAPPLTVVAYQKAAEKSSALGLDEWVMVATLVYIALQAGWLLWRWWKAASTKGWAPRE